MNDYERISRVIRYLDEHHLEQPDLARLADEAGLSSFHFHRLFSSWVGVTPKNFLQCLTLEFVKQSLQADDDILETTLNAGLSGPGRLHDLCVNLQAASPGELKSGGAGWQIKAGFAQSPFGNCLVAESPRGLCHLAFVDSQEEETAWTELQSNWPGATVIRDDPNAAINASKVFESSPRTARAPLKAFVRGTPFQVRVWQALLRIPQGKVVTYGRLAEAIGSPAAARAVGSAVGANPLAYLIPCHRVIRETGIIGDYRWGRLRKRAMVAWEGATTLSLRTPVTSGLPAADRL